MSSDEKKFYEVAGASVEVSFKEYTPTVCDDNKIL